VRFHATENKLHAIEQRVNVINLFSSPRRDYYSQVKNLAHVSYAWTTITRRDSPSMLSCHVELTVEHNLLRCVSFTNAQDDLLVSIID